MASKIFETGNPHEAAKTYSPLLEETFPQVRLRRPRRGYKKPPRFAMLAALAAAPKESQALTLAGAVVAVATSIFLIYFVALEQIAVKEQHESDDEIDLAVAETIAALEEIEKSAEPDPEEKPASVGSPTEVAMATKSPPTIEAELQYAPTEVHYFVLR